MEAEDEWGLKLLHGLCAMEHEAVAEPGGEEAGAEDGPGEGPALPAPGVGATLLRALLTARPHLSPSLSASALPEDRAPSPASLDHGKARAAPAHPGAPPPPLGGVPWPQLLA